MNERHAQEKKWNSKESHKTEHKRNNLQLLQEYKLNNRRNPAENNASKGTLDPTLLLRPIDKKKVLLYHQFNICFVVMKRPYFTSIFFSFLYSTAKTHQDDSKCLTSKRHAFGCHDQSCDACDLDVQARAWLQRCPNPFRAE